MHPTVAEITDAARLPVLQGDIDLDAPPVEGGPRWGPTIVALPDGHAVETLDAWTSEAHGFVGECWRTGARGSSHVSLRQLDSWRASDDPTIVAEGRRVLGDLAGAGRLRTRFVGIAVATGGVLAMLEPEGAAWDRVRSIADGRSRAVLHATLVHFTIAVEDPRSLLHWAARAPTGVRIDLDRLALVRYDHVSAASGMMPRILHEV